MWQSDYTSDDAINRSISILRVALSSKRNTFIKTMPKIGYRFSIPQEITIELVSSCQGAIVVKNTLEPDTKPGTGPDIDVAERAFVDAVATDTPVVYWPAAKN